MRTSGLFGRTNLVPSENNGPTCLDAGHPFPAGCWTCREQLAYFERGSSVSFPTSARREIPGATVFLAAEDLLSGYSSRGLRASLPRPAVTVELTAIPKQYFSTSPVRDEVTNGRLTTNVANPFFPLLPGTNLAASTVQRQQLLRPYPQFTSIQALETNGKSDYHAFQGRMERQMANGFTAQVAYTWSRLMTETNYLNNFDTELEGIVRSSGGGTHIFVVSGLAELPFGGATVARGLERPPRALGGWQISAITGAERRAAGFGKFVREGNTVDDIRCRPDRIAGSKWMVNGAPRSNLPTCAPASRLRTCAAGLCPRISDC